MESATGPEIAALRRELEDVRHELDHENEARRRTVDRQNAIVGKLATRLVVIESRRENEMEAIGALQREVRKHRDWLIELGARVERT